MFALAGVYAIRTTVLAPEFITGQLAAVQLYDRLYDEVVDAVLQGEGQGDAEAEETRLSWTCWKPGVDPVTMPI